MGNPKKVYSDKASGLNENRRGLKSLLNAAKKKEFDTLAITAKDRLTRFGFSYLEQLFKEFGVRIEILDNEREKSPQEELLQDFMSLLASFSGKFYKLRSLDHSKLLLKKAEEKLDENH